MSDIFNSQLLKAYEQFLVSFILGKPFEKNVLRGGKQRPDSTVTLHESVRYFCSLEKTGGKFGWTIEWENWKSKKLGTQRWPALISIETAEDLLFLTDKREEFRQFSTTLEFILKEKPWLRDWLAEAPHLVLKYREQWHDIFSVIDFLSEREIKKYYLRNIPVPVHTKFIEANKQIIWSLLQFQYPSRFSIPGLSFEEVLGLKQKPYLFTLRWLDKEMANSSLHGIEVFGLSVEELCKQSWQPEHVWMVENETALYMLPEIKKGLAIWSRGKALSLLKNIPMFSKAKLHYWGDLDEEGFVMLNDLRRIYPHAISRFMDVDCITEHLQFLDIQPKFYNRDNLELLTKPEQEAFAFLIKKNGRLEQEKILQSYVYEHI